MCLMVYLGTDAPVPGCHERPVGALGLDPARPRSVPPPLAGKAHIHVVCDRLETGWNCSCVLIDDVLPWAEAPDPAGSARRKTITAYEGLRWIAERALDVDPGALLFSCWSGEEDAPVAHQRDCAPSNLALGRHPFESLDGDDAGTTPPILVRLIGGPP